MRSTGDRFSAGAQRTRRAAFAGVAGHRAQAARKVQTRSGFTLVETLLALMILVILTGMVATGIPVAWRTYTAAVNGSNAKVLISTASSVLRDELSMAQDWGLNSSGELCYKDGEGFWAKLESKPAADDDSCETIVKQMYYGEDAANLTEAGDPIDLVAGASAIEELGVKFDSITYSDGIFTITNLQVVNADGDVYASTGDSDPSVFKVPAVMLR